MKLLSRIILTITLSVLTILLVLSITSKQIVNTVIKETWKAIVPTEILDNEYVNGVKDIISDIIGNKETNKINDWIKDKTNNSESKNWLNNFLNSEEVSTAKDWFSNSKEFEEIKDFINGETEAEEVNSFINSDEIGKIKDKLLNSKEYQKLKNSISKEKVKEIANDFIEKQESKMSFKERLAFRLLRFLANTRIKGLLILGIIGNIILLAFASWSLYKWLKNVFVSLILSGVGLYYISMSLNKAINSIVKVNIPIDIITIPAIVLIVSGIILLILYIVIVRIIKTNTKNKKED